LDFWSGLGAENSSRSRSALDPLHFSNPLTAPLPLRPLLAAPLRSHALATVILPRQSEID